MIDFSEVKLSISELLGRINAAKDALRIEDKERELRSIEAKMQEGDFWKNREEANSTMQRLKQLKQIVGEWSSLESKLKEDLEMLELALEDYSILVEIKEDVEGIKRKITDLEKHLLFSGRFDGNNAILEIQAGAGGTEACDWTSMLMRMYIRWAESKKYKVKTIHILPGEEAGIKSVTLLIEGPYAYGHLKAERGVHRLVRISPFDANKRRHTSFASVDVIPEIDEDIEVEVKDEDLRIDVFRSTGPGGQSVNTTDSAVRIVHLPTGIVVTCRNERSQLQNKQMALRMLKARLYELEEQKREAELAKERGEKKKIEWGSQIRSYVMQPYTMVKDHRTGFEMSNVEAVLDGEIDDFIFAFLKTQWKG